MYHRGMKWEVYRELDEFKDDLTDGADQRMRKLIESQAKAARQITSAQRRAAGEVASAQQRTAEEITAVQRETARHIADAEAETTRALERGFGALIASQGEMRAVMEEGFTTVSHGLQQIAGGVEALRADFDWAMSGLLWKVELQQETLQTILNTLQAPLDTQAKELRRRAEFAYGQGWYEEALKDFLASEERNYQDFAIHQAIANIYLYHKQPLELDKARAYYLKAGKYATPHSKYHAALGYLHGGFVCYLQRDDAAAIENARRAVELYPSWTEARYQLAKFAAAAGRAKIAIPALEKVIRIERNYAIKARVDPDFETIEAAATAMMKRLYAEAKRKVEPQWLTLRKKIDSYALAPQDKKRLEPIREEVASLMACDTYFDYLDVPSKLAKCQRIFDLLGLPERNRLRDEAAERLSRMRSEMEHYILPESIQQQLTTVEALFAEPMIEPEARKALQRVKELEREWDTAKKKMRQLMVFEHSRRVNCVAFSPDGAKLVTGTNRNMVWLRDLKEMEGKPLEGHTGPVGTVTFSPDGATLASGSEDKTVRLWDVETRREKAVLEGHTGAVETVTFGPDGSMLVTGSADKTIRLWDVKTGRQMATLDEHAECVCSVIFSPDGKTLASRAQDQTLRLWDVRAGRDVACQISAGGVDSMAFSPDGATLATGPGAGGLQWWNVRGKPARRWDEQDKLVRLWDARTGQEKAVLEGHRKKVDSVAFNPDGSLLASASSDGTVRLWDLETGGEQHTVLTRYHPFLQVTFSPDGMTLATRADEGEYVLLWDVRTEKKVALQHKSSVGVPADRVTAMVFSPDGAMLASASGSRAYLWASAMTRPAWERMERKRERQEQKRSEQRRRERERLEQERLERERQEEAERERALQQSMWRRTGRCEVCGADLGAIARALGLKRCGQHR